MKTLKRMKILKKRQWEEYDYVVINDDLKKCYNSIINIKSKNNSRYNRKLIKHINKLLA